MQIDTDFEGGSISVLVANDPADVTLALRPDNAADFAQWFFFRVRVAEGTTCGFRIENADEAGYPGGYSDYRVCVSYDGEHWFRIPTDYSQGELRFRLKCERDLLTIAYFPPFTSERHHRLLDRVRASSRARVLEIGRSVQGRPISLVAFGDQGRSLHRIWVVAQQHPGEAMAGFCAEGLLDRLLDEDDPIASALLAKAEVYVVPRMNPDGVAIGNHRTNAAGRDLNREWASPSDEHSPEVACVLRAIEERGGAEVFLDLHGDEEIPYVYAFSPRDAKGFPAKLALQEDRFCDTLARVSPDFQREESRKAGIPGGDDPRLSTSQIARRFDCLALGLEMPFTDNHLRADPEHGWSPERSRDLGRALVEALLAVLAPIQESMSIPPLPGSFRGFAQRPG